MTSDTLVVRWNNKGRGLYAGRSMRSGQVLEVAPLLVYPRRRVDGHTQRYVWYYGNGYAIPLGRMSLCNHSKKPNVEVVLDEETAAATLAALRAIAAGEELLIDYGDDDFGFKVLA